MQWVASLGLQMANPFRDVDAILMTSFQRQMMLVLENLQKLESIPIVGIGRMGIMQASADLG
jgi:hypothetical protein